MKKVTHLLLYLFVFHLHDVYVDSLKKGDACLNGRYVCASFTECPSALLDIKKGIYPVLCSIENSQFIICCTELQAIAKPTTSYYTNNDSVKFINRRKITISSKKCNEYTADACKDTSKRYNSPLKPQIVGGKESLPKEFPHMALIGYGRERAHIKWLCGGSLISERYILSAAHCAYSDAGEARWVRLGELDLESNVDNADPIDFYIVSRVVHPEYKAPSVYNDIALFKLNRVVHFTDYIRPLCLNEISEMHFKKFIASGWGTTGYGESTSSIMMNVDLNLIEFNACKKLYDKDEFLPHGVDNDRQLCAGYINGGKDTCLGDSGGPLQYINVQNRCSLTYTQVGIVSFGRGCASKNSPGIYTKVSYFIPWIENIVWK